MLNYIKKIVPKPLFSLYHLALAWSGNLVYSSPSKKLFLIGITGTKGKTTTSYLTYQLLQNSDHRAALTSTTFFIINDRKESNLTKMGMPGRFFLPRFLNKALSENINYAVVETTSEGIAQHRQYFLDYNTVVFTSLSPEHIERHGSFEAYREAKEKLFEQCKETHILNLDDDHAKHFLKYPAKNKWGITLNNKNLNQSVNKILQGTLLDPGSRPALHEGRGSSGMTKPGKANKNNKLKITEWQIEEQGKELVYQTNISLPFPGTFNAMNLLLAFAAARSAGVPFNKLIKNIPKLNLPPGRMQELTDLKIPFRVFLDYAHEPLSLDSALKACREMLKINSSKIICLTGAQGGGRDKWKREAMGKNVAKHADYVIIATEDPYEEDPAIINKAVMKGVLHNKNFKENKNCWQFTDRHEAIKKALELAKANDIVILCGKGGEKFMCIGDKKIQWDEEQEVRTIIGQ